jgi:hypothetical protein
MSYPPQHPQPRISLVRRVAPDKLNVDHYAVRVEVPLALQLWGTPHVVILELKPAGFAWQHDDAAAGWTRIGVPLDEGHAIARLDASLRSGRAYHLTDYNCEHFARFVVTGVARSTQVTSALTTLGLVAGAVLFVRALRSAA